MTKSRVVSGDGAPKGIKAREDLRSAPWVNLRPMDYEITSPCWDPHGLPGYPPLINLTLTSFVTSRSLVRTGILISGGNGKLTRFNQLYRTKLLPVSTDFTHRGYSRDLISPFSECSNQQKADAQIFTTRGKKRPIIDTRYKMPRIK